MCREFNLKENFSLLNENDQEVPEIIIKGFAESNLPNQFFLEQFLQPGKEPFCEKKYWRSFARILICRGIERLKDVKTELLIWLQDVNWPGFEEICKFVLSNFSEFKVAVMHSVIKALNEKDDGWFYSLWIILFKSKNMTEFEISKNMKMIKKLFAQSNNQTTVEEKLNEFLASD